ncbi:PEGA domain-containing protein [Rhodopseudomonas pseudopalustris]|uniref:PEGA domain-containing protein n=2 Tax=Rhodopseudomonas TaxID=1073 RepID=Q139F1_RHOPS|nr:PEGA domain-containing protein [Rhodopseudomonas pseudopalustris]ABE39288.1 conserved hypothetical protein [Rhodopseudomonas palustris BisB5]MBB1094216.1 PEGA domain-containing protein [Rhodopseudomonas palustris]SEO74695.1 PEGA domain-containing protein [Rhodopseudomonas pseudopalustris]
MRRFVVIAATGLSLAGCSSLSFDAFKSAPPTVTVQLDSVPPGAEALTSGGQSCKTPCSITAPAADFSVTFSQNKFQPATVPVQVVVNPGDFTTSATATATPNPVVAELQPATPVRKRKPVVKRVKKPKPAAAATTAPEESSPFPAPAAAAPAR